MGKEIYALTFCYEGTYNTSAYASTLFVSHDLDLLKAKMREYANADCEIVEDEWNNEKNYHIVQECNGMEITLKHNTEELYTKYCITSVEVLE
jgi:hypothetical protein